MLSVARVAAILAGETGVDSQPIARALRNWVATGRLIPTSRVTRGAGGYTEAQFDRVGVCKARLALAIAAAARELPAGDIIADAEAEEFRDLDPTTGRITVYSAEAAVNGTESGEDWFFTVSISRIDGACHFSGHWSKGAPSLDFSEVEAVSVFPFSQIIRPMLADLKI